MYAIWLSFNGDFGVNTDWNWLLRMLTLPAVSEYNLPSFLSGTLPFESCFEFLGEQLLGGISTFVSFRA